MRNRKLKCISLTTHPTQELKVDVLRIDYSQGLFQNHFQWRLEGGINGYGLDLKGGGEGII